MVHCEPTDSGAKLKTPGEDGGTEKEHGRGRRGTDDGGGGQRECI